MKLLGKYFGDDLIPYRFKTIYICTSIFTHSVQLHNYHTSYILGSPPLSLLCELTFTDFMIFSRNILIIKTGNLLTAIKQL